jgi:hypothetical protein
MEERHLYAPESAFPDAGAGHPIDRCRRTGQDLVAAVTASSTIRRRTINSSQFDTDKKGHHGGSQAILDLI